MLHWLAVSEGREYGSVWFVLPNLFCMKWLMIQVECLVSCTDMLYEMVYNFIWLDNDRVSV
jgi:hypothetical protein